MPIFRYKARKADGQAATGTVDAPDRAGAVRKLEREGLFPSEIVPDAGAPPPAPPTTPSTSTSTSKAPAPKTPAAASASPPAATAPAPSPAPAGEGTRLPQKDVLFFSQQLSILLGAGMTLDRALSVLAGRLQEPRLQSVVARLHAALVDGKSFSQALRIFPRTFSQLYVNLMAAGEASGALAEILNRLVTYLAKLRDTADRVRLALIYPAVLLAVGGAIVIVFTRVAVPQLEGFFKQTGGTLPLPTQILIGFSNWITVWGLPTAGAAIAGATLLSQWLRQPGPRRAWDAMILRVPVFGDLAKGRFCAQFARTLGTLLGGGVILSEALRLLESVAGNLFLQNRLKTITQSVLEGSSLSAATARSGVFPQLFSDMIAVGEHTGRLNDSMENIARHYEDELDKRVEAVTTFIPLVIIVLIAIVVGLMVWGIIAAVFGVTANLRNRLH